MRYVNRLYSSFENSLREHQRTKHLVPPLFGVPSSDFFGLSGFQVIWAFQQKSNLRSGHIGPPGHIWRKIERFKVISWQNPFLNT